MLAATHCRDSTFRGFKRHLNNPRAPNNPIWRYRRCFVPTSRRLASTHWRRRLKWEMRLQYIKL